MSLKTLAPRGEATTTTQRPCHAAFAIVIIIFKILLHLCKVFTLFGSTTAGDSSSQPRCPFAEHAAERKRRETIDIITSRTTHTILKHNGCRKLPSNITIETVNIRNVEVSVWATPLDYRNKDELLQRLLKERKLQRLEKVRKRLEYS